MCCLLFAGLPGQNVPQNLLHLQLWCVLATLGQLHDRMIDPYRKQPWSMAALVDSSVGTDQRIRLAQSFMSKRPCCVAPYFAKPLLEELQEPAHVCPPHPMYGKLCTAFRTKVSNMELECNFARAVKTRQAGQGHAHNQASTVAKHINAECKLSQRRLQACHQQKDHSAEPGHESKLDMGF